MKNILTLCAFMMFAGFATAQEATAAKTCTKGKAMCSKAKAMTDADANATDVLSASAVAELAAANDESIEVKKCDISGATSFFQVKECPASGKITKTEVEYSADTNTFVNLSPSEVMQEGEVKVIKTADTVDGEVQKTSKGAKKACCKGKKACGSKKTGV